MMNWDSLPVPPLTIEDYHPDAWDTWLKQFKVHTVNTPFSTLSDSEKVAVLLLKLGDDINPIFAALDVDIDNISYDELLRRFKVYFQPAKARNVFLTLKQKSSESLKQFAKKLTILSYPCGFGPFRDGLLRDVFLANIDNKYSIVRDEILESQGDPGFRQTVALAEEIFLKLCGFNSVVQTPSSCSSASILENKLNYGPNPSYNRSQNLPSSRGPRHSNDSSSFRKFVLPPIEVGDIHDVQILAVNTTRIHFFPLSAEETRNQFFKCLNEALNKKSTTVDIAIDKKYAIPLEERWFRVRLAGINSDKTATVQSIDFGWWKHNVPLSAFRMIPLDLLPVHPLCYDAVFVFSHERSVEPGQRVRFKFVDVVDGNMWSVRLAESDSTNGLNDLDKEKITCNQDRGSQNMSGSKKIQTTNFHSKEYSCDNTSESGKGNRIGGNYGNRREQKSTNYKNLDEQKPKKADKNQGNECKTNTGGEGVGREQHNRRGQNPGSISSSGTEALKQKNYKSDIDCQDQPSGKEHKANRSSDGTNKRDQNAGNKCNSGFMRNRNSDEFNNSRPGGGYNEKGSTRRPGVTSSSIDSRTKSSSNCNDQDTNPDSDSKGFSSSGNGKKQHEAKSSMPNGFNDHGDFRRSNDGTKGTRNGNERDSRPNNRRSGGEKGGYSRTATGSNPNPNLTKHQRDDTPPIPSDQFTRVFVCNVNDTPKWSAYVCPESSKEKFQELFDRVQDTCSSTSEILRNPSKGMRCAAPFDGDYYRAEIQEVHQSSATVLFYDFGNDATVPNENLMVLPPALSEASLSFPVKFAESFKIDLAFMDSIEVRPKILGEGGIWVVDVKGCNNNLNDQTMSSLPTNVTASRRSTDMPQVQNANDVVRSSKSNSPSQLSGIQTGGTQGRSSTAASSRPTTSPQYQPVDDSRMRSPKLPIPKNTFSDVRVVYTGTEGTFVVPFDKLEEMRELCFAVKEVAENESPCLTPILTKVYAAPFDGDVYRAKVIAINRDSSSCRVEFIDFGNECDVDIHDLLQLPPNLTKPVFIFKIRLDSNCDIILEEGMDVSISPITLESDGSLLVQLEGEPLSPDYQLPEQLSDRSDSCVGFTRKSAEGAQRKNERSRKY